MKVYLVNNKDKLDWCMDYAMVVIAEDELHAERCARCNSDSFKKAKIEVIEIDTSNCEERVILKANTGT
jgi:hypothetical protein